MNRCDSPDFDDPSVEVNEGRHILVPHRCVHGGFNFAPSFHSIPKERREGRRLPKYLSDGGGVQ